MRRLLIFGLVLSFACSMWAAQQYTLVIDPGHGGKDPGAIGKISQEKDLNLKLALRLGKLIKEQYPDVNVVYTRSSDVFIPLQERADIANKNNADLFISIHTNSAESRVPNGVETFILGTEKMEKNLDVAMRENAVMKLEADYKTTYQGFDPNSIDSYIMFELMQNSYMDQSLQYATLVQEQFVGKLNRGDRGVRQAAFWVLLKTACPSILFEMGFISNPEEEKYLNRESAMDQMAQALVNAFGTYTRRTKAVEPLPVEAPQSAESTQSAEQTQSAESTQSAVPAQNPSEQTTTSTPAKPAEPATTTVPASSAEPSKPAEPAPNTTPASTTAKSAPTTTQPASDSSPKSAEPILDNTTTNQPLSSVSQASSANPQNGTYYAVQVCATKELLNPTDPRLKGQKCEYIQLGGWYKYYTAADPDRNKVVSAQQKLKPLFPDCWIITLEK